jgi:hypothetical protein
LKELAYAGIFYLYLVGGTNPRGRHQGTQVAAVLPPDITGNNNLFTVKPDQAYSEVLGNSTLDIKNFLILQGAKAAGAPNTPSNP